MNDLSCGDVLKGLQEECVVEFLEGDVEFTTLIKHFQKQSPKFYWSLLLLIINLKVTLKGRLYVGVHTCLTFYSTKHRSGRSPSPLGRWPRSNGPSLTGGGFLRPYTEVPSVLRHTGIRAVTVSRVKYRSLPRRNTHLKSLFHGSTPLVSSRWGPSETTGRRPSPQLRLRGSFLLDSRRHPSGQVPTRSALPFRPFAGPLRDFRRKWDLGPAPSRPNWCDAIRRGRRVGTKERKGVCRQLGFV